MNVGMIGVGVVGMASADTFGKVHKLFLYDKYKDCGSTLKEVAQNSEVIFICVPTPMLKSGEIGLLAVYESVKSLNEHMSDEDETVIVIRSTAVSGSTNKLAETFPSRNFAVNPEFLTEANPSKDFSNSERVIIGVEEDNVFEKVKKVYEDAGFKCPIVKTSFKVAEMAKYTSNCFLAAKASFANEIYDICQAIDVDYNEVVKLVLYDSRIGKSHWQVPGPDGDFGWGGKCLVAGTKLLTDNNDLVNIEDIEKNGHIYDGKNFTCVTKKGNREVETIEIKSRGRFLCGSRDHIQFIYENGKLKQRELKNIDIGDWIFIPRIKSFNSKNEYIFDEKPNKSINWWPSKIKMTKNIGRIIGLFFSIPSITKSKYGFFLDNISLNDLILSLRIRNISA